MHKNDITMVCGNHFAVGQKNVCGKYTNIYVTEKLSFCLFNIYCIIDVEKLVVAYAVSLSTKGCFVCCFFTVNIKKENIPFISTQNLNGMFFCLIETSACIRMQH